MRGRAAPPRPPPPAPSAPPFPPGPPAPRRRWCRSPRWARPQPSRRPASVPHGSLLLSLTPSAMAAAAAEQQQFYLLLGNLLSPDNVVRKQAEVSGSAAPRPRGRPARPSFPSALGARRPSGAGRARPPGHPPGRQRAPQPTCAAPARPAPALPGPCSGGAGCLPAADPRTRAAPPDAPPRPRAPHPVPARPPVRPADQTPAARGPSRSPTPIAASPRSQPRGNMCPAACRCLAAALPEPLSGF